MKPIYNKLIGLPEPEVLLFDLDGTLYRGNTRITGADRLIAELEQKGKRCFFVTNNSTRTPSEVAHHLKQMGIEADEARVVTSATATAYYINQNYTNATAYVIGERGLREALTEIGVRILEDASHEHVDLVIQGLDRQLTYAQLTRGLQHLLQGAKFIQTNPDRLLPMDDRFIIGAGSIGAALQASSGIEPIVIGKPSPILMNYAMQIAGAKTENTWVIGDNPYTDIAAGEAVGCSSIMVLTGFCNIDNWEQHCHNAGVTPQAVCEDLQVLHQMLI
ncbi:MAG: HAD-IIA family hydrolase [Candidatus Cohnella colombiensis]|uniref:Acid sugar phosphatase n=1 Tax=Candidatus Cohnella colombiensis TaxID=3121368 RepID=A0AA95JE91_9BACL|nr:MAG: HAD-IIA family hydrolase [Cohnella sp.]